MSPAPIPDMPPAASPAAKVLRNLPVDQRSRRLPSDGGTFGDSAQHGARSRPLGTI